MYNHLIKRDWERERERDGKLQSGIKEVKVIYMPYDYNFILTLTLTWFDRLSIILSVKAFLGRSMSLWFLFLEFRKYAQHIYSWIQFW